MKRFVAVAIVLITAGMAVASSVPLKPVVPEADGYIPIAGAALAPDPRLTYRLVFDARKGAEKPSDLVPTIDLAAAELNAYVASKVPAARVHIAMVFHANEADAALLDNAHYRRTYGIDNPNLKPLAEMRKAGVQIYVCGQQLAADGVDLKSIAPEVTIAADGLVALTYF